MTIAGHARRMHRLKPPQEKWSLVAALLELKKKEDAVLAIVAWAKELAGGPRDWRATAAATGSTAAVAAERVMPPPIEQPPKARWTKTRRPGPFDVLTWDEIMQVPWIEGDDHLLGDDKP